jgi:hypothetical protein
MTLNELLDEIIFKEAYTPVKVVRELKYQPSELPKDIVEKLETDGEFKKSYQEKIRKLLKNLGHEKVELLAIDPASHSLTVRYTAYYTGSRQFPEIHLKTLLVLYDAWGIDIRDPEIFSEIVEKARCDLGEKNRKEKEERLNHFASLFKRALEEENAPNEVSAAS